MRRSTSLSFVFVLLATTTVGAAELTLKRVMLSTGGVGYYEFETTVTGRADVELTVRRDQVDDVLKSLVVYDAKGRIHRVSLPGQDSEAGLFREMPFRAETLGSLTQLLDALRGADIEAGGLRGRLLAVAADTRVGPSGTVSAMRHRVSVLTGSGIQQFVLEEADSLRFLDPQLQAQLERALVGVAKLSNRDRRTMTIALDGDGERRVRVGYVAAAPLWKATYRATLPADPSGKTVALQGWAVVENESGQDWRDVELTLVSGTPITLRQALYAPYFVERPTVPVEVWGRVLPPGPDQGARVQPSARVERLLPPPEAPLPGRVPHSSIQVFDLGRSIRESAEGQQPALALLAVGEAADSDTQVSFRAPTPVSVATGHSLMVPLVARDVPGERLALFRRGAQPRHPLASLRFTNDGATALPPGVVAIYGQTPAGAEFLGDARLAPIPAGEARLVSYAVDYKTRIEVEEGSAQTLVRVRASDGVMIATRSMRQTIAYVATTAPGEARVVTIEAQRQGPDIKVLEPPAGDLAIAPDALRTTRRLAGGTTTRVPFVFERIIEERVDVNTLSAESVQVYLRSPALTATQKAVLERLSQLAQAQRDHGLQVASAETQL
ncbi:MAG: DUF4139 domain-containing protein, partial [Alphaproteobacteria bacterium]|nr:DUF4139 domain-containing protein [Alphaproteobacteria bacterium]